MKQPSDQLSKLEKIGFTVSAICGALVSYDYHYGGIDSQNSFIGWVIFLVLCGGLGGAMLSIFYRDDNRIYLNNSNPQDGSSKSKKDQARAKKASDQDKWQMDFFGYEITLSRLEIAGIFSFALAITLIGGDKYIDSRNIFLVKIIDNATTILGIVWLSGLYSFFKRPREVVIKENNDRRKAKQARRKQAKNHRYDNQHSHKAEKESPNERASSQDEWVPFAAGQLRYENACKQIGIYPERSLEQLKIHWRYTCKQWHPDTGGTHELWLVKSSAYDLLVTIAEFKEKMDV